MASTRKLTKSLTRSLTRKLTGDELQQLFLEKFKLTLGSELIANGTFDDDISNWTQMTGATIAYSNGTINVQTTNYIGAQQFVDVSQNTAYRITFDVVSTTTSTGRIYIGTSSDKDAYGNHTGLAVGTHTFDVTTINNSSIQLRLSTADASGNVNFDNVSVKEIIKQAPLAAFSLRKLGNVSPYACRIRRSSDNTEAQVMFDASDRVSESSVVRNTSQNLLSFSEQLNNSAWSNNQGGTATLSTITDPFGGTNSYEVSGGSETYGGIYDTITGLLTTGKNYVYSIYLKKGTSTKSKISYYDSTSPATNLRLTIDWASDGEGTINTGETSTADLIATSFEEIGTDGWYRASIAFTAVDTNDVQTLTIEPDRTGNGNTVLAFGAQLEEATNYFNEGTQIINDTFSSNSGWTVNVGSGINSTVAIEDNSLKFNVIDNGYVRATKAITYDENKYYILTATVNGTAGKAMRFRDDSGDLGGLTDGFDPPTGAGGKVSGIVTMTGSPQQVSFTWIPTAQSDEIIIERHSSGTYEFTVDDLLIKEYDPLYQDDFTTDTSWNTSQSGSSTVTIPSNGKALLTVANTNPNYASMSKSLTYDEGSRYRVTATIKGTSGKTVRFRDTFNTGGGLQANATGTQTEGRVTLNGSDQSISLDFTATSASDKIIFERDAFAVGTCTIDNLIIQKLIPSTSEYISTPVVSNDGLQFVESDLDSFVGGENHLPRSQDFDNWNEVGGSQTIVENHVNHLGESTASLITTTTTGARIEKVISIVAGQTYVASVWVKRYNSSRFEMYVLQGGPSYAPQGYIRANISSSDGSLSTHENHSNTSEITYTDFGEGWYRASFKFTATSDDNSAVFRLRAGANNDGNADLDANKGAYFFGAQLNKDSLKDYQKTEATARDGRASIVTLYNAVGGEDAHQATQTDQPLLYHRGLLVRDGTSPAMLFTQTQRKHLDLQNLSALTTGHIFAVLSVTNDPPDGTAAQGSNRLWELGTGGNSHHPFAHASTSTVAHSFGSDTRKSGLDLSSLNLENKHLLTIKSKTNDWNMRIDGVSKQTASTNTVAFPSAPFIGSDSSVFGGKYSEIILFDSDQDSNIDAIQSDIADFHNITLL
tara:strand:- start:3040 stop:6354 length:3315 start_codon:yes stop_codon:yes gene_type:complete